MKTPGKKKRGGPPETLWKPGVSANPAGRPKGVANPIPHALKNLTVETYRKVIEVVCSGNLDELKRMIEDPQASVLQVGIARAFYKAMNAGDYETIERIAQRIVGKIPEELKVTSQNLNANVDATGVVTDEKVRQIMATIEEDI